MQIDSLFKKWFSLETLEERFYNRVRYKSSPGLDKIGVSSFYDNLEENLEIINKKVFNDTYKFTKYKELLISKGRDKNPRVISRPTIRDKVLLSSLQGYIKESFISKLDNRLPHTKIDNIVRKLSDYQYFVKIDIKEFYQSINHKKLLEILDANLCFAAINLIKEAITTPTVSRDFSSITSNPPIPLKGVPEGLSISNVLAEIYLKPIDDFYQKKQGIAYCRYVDDILLLCNKSNFRHLQKNIVKKLKKIKLQAHSFENSQKMAASKISNGFCYLGYHYSPEFISVKASNKNRFEHSLEKIFSNYSNTANNKKNYNLFLWKLNIKISGCIHNRKKFGWMFFYSQISDLQLLKHLDWLVSKLFERYKIPKPSEPVKSFFRTYHEIKYNLNSSNYFLNIDRMTFQEMAYIIENVFDYLLPAKKEDAEKLFFDVLYKFINELEKDVQFFS